MDCPHCDKPLVAVERDQIEVDWCPRCGGLWFDAGELDLLAEKTGRRLSPADLGRGAPEADKAATRRCPRCRERMEGVAAGPGGNLRAERCVPHGLWLDRGELGAIVSHLARNRESDEGVILKFLGETFGGAR